MKSAPKMCHLAGAAGALTYLIMGLIGICAPPHILAGVAEGAGLQTKSLTNQEVLYSNYVSLGLVKGMQKLAAAVAAVVPTDLTDPAAAAAALAKAKAMIPDPKDTEYESSVVNLIGIFPCTCIGSLTYFIFPTIVLVLLSLRVFVINKTWLKVTNAVVIGSITFWMMWDSMAHCFFCCCAGCISEQYKAQRALPADATIPGLKSHPGSISCCFSCFTIMCWLYFTGLCLALGSILFCDVCDNDKEVTTEATYGAV